MAEDELAELRRRRMAELQRQQASRGVEDVQRAQQEAEAREEADAQREAIMRQILTPEARDRLARIKIARPDEARSLENQLIQLAQSGRLRGQLDDAQLKQILARLQPGGREPTIRRK